MTDRGAIPSWAVKGAQVVFVGGFGFPLRNAAAYGVTVPAVRVAYTIREVVTHWSFDGAIGLRLHEIRNRRLYTELQGLVEPCFSVAFFRPLVTRSQDQDVAQFRKLLAHQPEGVDA